MGLRGTPQTPSSALPFDIAPRPGVQPGLAENGSDDNSSIASVTRAVPQRHPVNVQIRSRIPATENEVLRALRLSSSSPAAASTSRLTLTTPNLTARTPPGRLPAACGHGRIQDLEAGLSRKYRHIWTCACKRCGRGAVSRRQSLRVQPAPGRDVPDYLPRPLRRCGSPRGRSRPEVAPGLWTWPAMPHLAGPRLAWADIRLALAEAQGRKVLDRLHRVREVRQEHRVGHQQAYEAGTALARSSFGLVTPSNRGQGR